MPYRFLTIESSNGIQIDHCVKKKKKKKKKKLLITIGITLVRNSASLT